MTLLRRTLWRVYMPVFRWLIRRLGPPADPWERLDVRMPLHYYGSGVQYDFPAYLAGLSTVSVQSFAEIQEWLLGCDYQTDTEQFGGDHWQDAIEFERRRVGDCDDHALWAWRKLIELGVDATLVVGWCLPITRPLSRHVWVTFRDDSGEYLFETATPSREEMLRPLSEARAHYRPEYGVDRRGRRFTYAGALLFLREQLGIDPLPPEVVDDGADRAAPLPANPHLRALQRRTGLPFRSLQSELRRLERLGVLVRRPEGRRVHYALDERSPRWHALRALVRELADPVDVLRDAIADVTGLDAAFVFGSEARGDIHPDSDVDVFILAGDDFSEDELSRRTLDAGVLLGREINVVAMSRDDLVKRVSEGSGFLRGVLDNPKRWIVGDTSALRDLLRRRGRK